MADTTLLRSPIKVFNLTTSPDNTLIDGALTFTDADNGQSGTWMDIGLTDWERITIDIDITNMSGAASVVFKVKTANTTAGTAVTATTMDAFYVRQSGVSAVNTNIASAAKSAIGRFVLPVCRQPSFGYFAGGKLIQVYQDVTGTFTLFKKAITMSVFR